VVIEGSNYIGVGEGREITGLILLTLNSYTPDQIPDSIYTS